MYDSRKLSKIEAIINLCLTALFIFAVIWAFCVEKHVLQEQINHTQNAGDQLGAGLTYGFGVVFSVLGSIGLGITSILIVISSLGLLLSKEGQQGFSILGIVAKVLSLLCLWFVSAVAARVLAYVIYIILAVLLLGTIVASIVLCVYRKRAFL